MKFNTYLLVLIYLSIVAFRFLSTPSDKIKQASPVVLGGIVPHHLLVKDLIGRFFQQLPPDNIDHLIILGPNHLELGEEKIIFEPKFSDQSFSALEPFIKDRFPESEIIKVAIKYAVSPGDCESLAKKIHEIPGTNLVIASIDFSHYLSSEHAQKNDQLILDLINNRDYQQILRLDSDYLDSPGSLVAALQYFELAGVDRIELLENTDSGSRGNPFAPTTSYMSMVFYAEK